jgi:hypothetical protein
LLGASGAIVERAELLGYGQIRLCGYDSALGQATAMKWIFEDLAKPMVLVMKM